MRLIDATEAATWARIHILDATEKYAILDFLRECATIDAVPVVRCKDCKYFAKEAIDEDGWCENPDGLDNIAKQTDFCPYGERKETDNG